MKTMIKKLNSKRIINATLIIVGILIISFSFFNNNNNSLNRTSSVNQDLLSSEENNLFISINNNFSFYATDLVNPEFPPCKENNLCISNYYNNITINGTSSSYDELLPSEENNNINRKDIYLLINAYASGITSSDNNERLIIYSTCIFLGVIALSEFGIVLKKKRDRSADAYKDEVPSINNSRLENLESKEYIVLGAVRDYLSKNKPFDKDAIVRYTVSRFAKTNINYNKNGIREILQSLFDKKLIVEGSKFLRSDVLINQNRMKVFNCIVNNPGIPFMEIVRALNMSNFVVKWHLNMLLRFDFVRTQNIDNHEAYFDSNFKSQDDNLMHFLSRVKYRKIIDYLKFNGGATKHELSKELLMHPTTVSKYIKNLEECGLLSGSKYSNKTLFFLKEDFFDDLGNFFN